MATTALIAPGDLQTHLRLEAVDTPAAASAERVAWGWLSEATGLTERPDPVPDVLWSWALELAGLVYDNPRALATEGTGPFGDTRERGRREAILAAAARHYGRGGGVPRGTFPDAQPWPDPVCVRPPVE